MKRAFLRLAVVLSLVLAGANLTLGFIAESGWEGACHTLVAGLGLLIGWLFLRDLEALEEGS